MSDPGSLRAPSLDDLDTIARRAFEQLPEEFRRLCEGLVIHVVDFPDDETRNRSSTCSGFSGVEGSFRAKRRRAGSCRT